MKVILGDNQFFGINHFDINKAESVKRQFTSEIEIMNFLRSSLKLGLDGYMINSNDIGVSVVESFQNEDLNTELHYSIPYPHKYASLVNEIGLIGLLILFLKSFKVRNIFSLINFIFTLNLRYLLPIVIELELPKKFKNSSFIYLQTIVVDLLLGMPKADLIFKDYAVYIRSKNHTPGFITMNLQKLVNKLEMAGLGEVPLIICFNINKSGFNVFPNREEVIATINYIRDYHSEWKLMGMSIMESGSMNSKEPLNYRTLYNLDYLVFGSSKHENILTNLKVIRGFSL